MLSQLRYLKGYVNPGRVEGSTSLLANQITSIALFASCLLVSSLQYFGSPIQCVQDKKEDEAAVNEDVMNSFCFISSTYTISQDKLGYGCETGFGRGIGPANNEGIRRHAYYVWIPFVLFLQALAFLAPLSYWKYCEGGLIGKLLNGVLGLDSRDEKIRGVAAYFEKRLSTHRLFAFAWFSHDLLSLAVTVGNFLLTDSLLGGRFRSYGWTVSSPGDSSACGTLAEDVFPKLTKCTFYKFGSGGSLQNFDSLCVMALNVVNEKIYIVLWFWFLLLVPASILSLLVKTGVMACLKCLPKRRLAGLVAQIWARLLIGCPNLKNPKRLSRLVYRFTLSDWIFFSCLVSGMSSDICEKFVAELEELVEKDDVAPSENA